MIREAKELMRSTSNPIEALQKAGVTPEMIEKAKTYLDNPLANTFCKSLNIDKSEVMNVLNSFSDIQPQNSSSVTSSDDELDKLSKTLSKLQNKQ